MFKGILLDLDNTLYEYDRCHEFAIGKVEQFVTQKLNISEETFSLSFNEAKHQVKSQVGNTAASHNRLLYMQIMCEILGVPASQYAYKLYNEYWDNYLSLIEKSLGVDDFLFRCKQQGLKICLVSDLTAHIQYRKINTLGIAEYIDYIVTSEEVGIEKPSALMFEAAVKKIQLGVNEVCMVGDNLERDIKGALTLDIAAFWINHRETVPQNINLSKVNIINNFTQLVDVIFPDARK